MNTFTITEKQNMNSTRQGFEVQASSLAVAKRAATKSRCFIGTILTIQNAAGAVVAIHNGKKWMSDHFVNGFNRPYESKARMFAFHS